MRHPLQEAGFTKADVRALAKAWNLPTWDKPASPCLSRGTVRRAPQSGFRHRQAPIPPKLTDVRGQIEQLVAEKQQLEQRAAFGTLTVVFSLPVTPKAEAVRLGWDPATDVDRATGALLGIGQAAATLGIWFGIVGLPLLVVLAILGVIAWRVRRVLTDRRALQPGAGA